MANKFTDAMLTLAAEAAREPSWHLYAGWCEARACGDRDRAAAKADAFAAVALSWSFEDRQRFSLWLMKATGWVMELCGGSALESRRSTGGSGLFAPRQVVEIVLLPTLAEWQSKDPTNAEAWFWLGLYSDDIDACLIEAIHLDPEHGLARASLAKHILATIGYAQHELPSGYIGNPADDLTNLHEVETLLTASVEPPTSALLLQEARRLQEVAEAWIRLQDTLEGLAWSARCSLWQTRMQGKPGDT